MFPREVQILACPSREWAKYPWASSAWFPYACVSSCPRRESHTHCISDEGIAEKFYVEYGSKGKNERI